MTPVALLILFVVAAVAPALCRVWRRGAGLLVAAAPAGLGVWFATRAPGVFAGGAYAESWSWLPGLGLDLSFRVDGLSLAFALLILFIGAMVVLYASSYLGSSPRLGSFLSTLTAFMGAMAGLVLADNLILLFVFWELTSITSFLLIGFEHERERARWASVQALLTTGLGGLALLAGLVLMGLAGGSWTISELVASPLHGSSLYTPMAILLLLGAFTKSAIFPFHFWLPNAMEAPSPVSALLHSATMVKAGVYLVARLHPAMSGTMVWDETLALAGGVTMVLGAFLATRQTQLKKILAYSTVSSLGVLIMLLGLGAVKAAATYLLAHALFKGCLFLVAGTLTKVTGEKDPDRLGGLLGRFPLLGLAAIVSGLSMAGMFPLIGFVGKELLLKAGLAHPEWAVPATAGAALAGTLTVMVALLVGVRPFLMPAVGDASTRGDGVPWRQVVGPVVLSACGVVAGLAPGVFAEPLVASMIAAIDPSQAGGGVRLRWMELLWPRWGGWFFCLWGWGGGGGLFWWGGCFGGVGGVLSRLDGFGPARWYDGAMSLLSGVSAVHTRVVQNGSLQAYIRVTLLVVIGVVGLAFSRSFDWGVIGDTAGDVTALEAALVGALAAASLAAVMMRTALATVSCLSGVGFVIAILFAMYGAPDLAMTQFSMETLLLIIFVLVLFHVPRYRDLSNRAWRLLDTGLAGAFGLVLAAAMLAVLGAPAAESVAAYYAEHSVTGGYGRNVVNVILVDFRALDTLGEVFVIGVAAIGVFTMLRLRSGTGGGEPA